MTRNAAAIITLGVLLGTVLPELGCGRCNEFELEGTYVVDGQPPRDWVEGSGGVEIDETTIVISYTKPDGSEWEVEYVRTETRVNND